jgi:hypothetical protein
MKFPGTQDGFPQAARIIHLIFHIVMSALFFSQISFELGSIEPFG